MSFTMKNVVPWGRSFQEYRNMFHLTDQDLSVKILGCGDGPAAFNGELSRKGGSIVSADPLYQFSKEEIAQRIEETFEEIMIQTKANQEQFIWKDFSSPEELGKSRMESMAAFLEDYEAGKEEERYQPASLPNLPFSDKSFDLSLCSHFLFLYSKTLDLEMHIASLKEMMRCSREARIFPLLSLDGEISPHLEKATEAMKAAGFQVERVPVTFHFQKGGNEMLVIKD